MPKTGERGTGSSAQRGAPVEPEKAVVQSLPHSYTEADAVAIASLFDIRPPVRSERFQGTGNVHKDTFLVTAGGPGYESNYLLQRLNQGVFTRPDLVMRSMVSVIEAQLRNLGIVTALGDPEWQPLELVRTRAGAICHEPAHERGRECWRLMVYIPDTVTYKSLSELATVEERLRIAEEAGRGLAIYGDLVGDLELRGYQNPLPGYRDTELYYAQFEAVLRECRQTEDAGSLLPLDPVLLSATGQHFRVALSPEEYRIRRERPEVERLVEIAREHSDRALSLQRLARSGELRTVPIHGDPKIENFLFCERTNRVKSLVDLDTIMPHTWLADWGDMVRSFVNVAGECERDASKVTVDLAIFEAVARGFLSCAKGITEAEIRLMPAAVQAIALELGVRFLADYLRGDTYFQLGDNDPPDLNLVRGRVQIGLFERLRAAEPQMGRIVRQIAGLT